MPWLKVRCWLSGRADVEAVRVREALGVAVGGGEERDETLPRLDRLTPPTSVSTVAVRPREVHGPVEAQQLLHRARRERRVGDEALPLVAAGASIATVPLPMRFIVVSWPATKSSTTVERSSSSESRSPSSSAGEQGGERGRRAGRRAAPRRSR